MPNHVHLLIKQKNKDSIQKFTKSLFTRYSMYFNKKYKRVGPLFQGIYKATNVIDDGYLLDLTKYIHLNPVEFVKKIEDGCSSYADYVGLKNTAWIDKSIVMDKFKTSHFVIKHKIKSYRNFVEGFDHNSDIMENLDFIDLDPEDK